MLSPKGAKAVFESSASENRRVGTCTRREKDVLSAEDIKQSKDRINALRNIFPFYGGFRGSPLGLLVDDGKEEAAQKESAYSRKQPDEDDEEEKEKCEGGSDSESCLEDSGLGRRSIVQGRIASYELPRKDSSLLFLRNPSSGVHMNQQATCEADNNYKDSSAAPLIAQGNIVCNQAYQVTDTSKESQKFWPIKERYPNSVTNFTYEGFDFGFGGKDLLSRVDDSKDDLDNRMIKKVDNDFAKLKSDPTSKCSGAASSSSSSSSPSSKDNLIYQLKSEIDNLSHSSKTRKSEPSNVIFGNKDILKLLSNKHLANLNIRVERSSDFRKDRLADNKWRDTFRSSRPSVRASFRSSKRKRKCKYKSNAPHPSSDEKGTSDSTLKENESSSESGEELKERLHQGGKALLLSDEKESVPTGEYVKKKFPEYAKVNKRKGGIALGVSASDVPPRSLSTSPIERAPVVKKICSSGVRLKKDSEPSLMANPVKKLDSFRGSRVTRRNSFLYNTKGKSSSKEGIDHQDSFVKTQATRLRRRSSKCAKKSEYRVSVTIRPSTVANLANKFNTIILQNQTGGGSRGENQPHLQQQVSSDVDQGKVSLLETPTKVPTRYYSSPRASFKRKYRHKASRAAKETKEKELISAEKELLQGENGQGIDNTIYYTETAPKRRSLNNSLPELNMKDLFDDADYNKTDEEKVCEKLKTALSSAKFKGETDDSEDDLASRPSDFNEEASTVHHEVVGSSHPPSNGDQNNHSSSNGDQILQTEKGMTSDEKVEGPGQKDGDTSEATSQGKSDSVDSYQPKLDKWTDGRTGEGYSKSDSVDSGNSADEGKESKETSFLPDKSSAVMELQIGEKENSLPTDATQPRDETWKLDVPELGERTSVEKIMEINEAINAFFFVDNLLYAKADTLHLLCEDAEDETEAETDKDRSTSGSPKVETMPSETDENKEGTLETFTAGKKKDQKPIKDQKVPPATDELLLLQQASDGGSLIEDSCSEVGSVSSDLKAKKTKSESSIYTSLKAVVKNTVRKTKDKDSEVHRTGDMDRHRKRSPSRDRDKWYKRNKSKERKSEQAVPIEFQEPKEKQNTREKYRQRQQNNKEKKDGGVRLYEKWGFKRFTDRNEERKKDSKETANEHKMTKATTTAAGEEANNATSKTISEKNQHPLSTSTVSVKDEHPSSPKTVSKKDECPPSPKTVSKKDECPPSPKTISKKDECPPSPKTVLKKDECPPSPKNVSERDEHFSSPKTNEGKDEELYGKLKFASRSRSREKRMAKELGTAVAPAGGQRYPPLRKLDAAPEGVTKNPISISEEAGEDEVFVTESEALVSPSLEPSPPSEPPQKEMREEELSLYEPHSPTGVKVIPPPPKTPIPSPPKSFKKFFMRQKSSSNVKGSSSSSSRTPRQEETSDGAAENIYENIYSPDVETLKRNRERLEEEGIKPISSFLWSESAILSARASKEANKMASGTKVVIAKTGSGGVSQSTGRNRGRKEEEEIYGECAPRSNTTGTSSRGKTPMVSRTALQKLKTQRNDDDDEDERSSVRYDKIGSPSPSLFLGTPSKPSFSSPFPSKYEEGPTPDGGHHNYTEIQNNSSGDSQTVLTYDDIGGPGSAAVSYDEIAAPSSSCSGYDDIQPPSTHECYDPYKNPSEGYDPVNPPQPKSDSSQYDECGGVVMARPAVVKDQPDITSYVYDDISMYNASQVSHSYEPVCPPGVTGSHYPASLVVENPDGRESLKETPSVHTHPVVKPENKTSEALYESDGSDNSPHEVFSYKLTKIGAGVNSRDPPTELVDLSKGAHQISENASVMKRKKRNSQDDDLCSSKVEEVEADSWEDVSDSEEENEFPVTLTTKLPFYRRERCPKKTPRHKVPKKSWTQGVRDVASAHNSRFHTHVLSSSLAKVNPHAHGRAHITPIKAHPAHSRGSSDRVITYSWRQRRPDSECDEESPGHYEAIYEVISPADDDDIVDQNQAEGDLKDNLKDDLKYDLKDDLKDDYLQCPPDDPDLDDSFDSDDSDEAYSRLRPQFADRTELPSSLHREVLRPVSMDSAAMDSKKYLRRKYNRSHSHQPPHHGINKIAEAANLGMKRLRRNWSLTKNEVRTGLNRIKKKSTFSMSDMKSAEDIVNEVGGSSGDKSKWSFKSHFRKKSATLSPLLATTPLNEDGVVGGRRNSKDNATFYLTLTIASERQDASTEEGAEGGGGAEASSSVPSVRDERRRKLSITPSVSSTASSLCETTLTKTRPLSAPGPSLYRNSSTGSNSGTLFRPTNPPPAPPTGTTSPDDDEPALDMSKDRLALRLNQILSAGPIAPPGRRVLRTSESCSSSDVSPVPLLLPPEDKQLLKPLAHVASPKGVAYPRQVFPAPEQGAALTPLSAPRNRGSVASSSSSHGSSEGYIRPSDIATSPPPLPARPTSSSYPPLRRVSTGSGTGTQPSLSSTPGKVQTLLRSPSKTSSLESDSKSYLELNYEAQGSDDPPYISSHFADEPLYQFYTAKVERAALYQGDSSEDDYEVINDGGALITSYLKGGPRPTAMELVTPADGRRTLWCELAEVIGSGILSKISGQERKLQEAMFEVITSEASYLKSLEVLVSHFMNCPEFSREEDPVVSRRDMNVLFSDILPVKKCSELFLGDLEKRWQESVYISGITDVVLKHATSSFNVYVKYCSNQIYQDRKLRHLKENNPRFVDVLFRLETAPVCQSLAMQSFLMLPMQRVTRLPLLIDAIFNRLEYGSSQWQECKVALASLQKIVTECNEAARKMERMEEMLLISHQLDFREVKAIPLISASRWLVKKGELTRLTWREGDNKLTFGRKISKHSLYFFLFTDLLVVTKKKSDDQHMVLDYCPRNMVQVLELESADKFPGRILDGHKNLIIMTMLQNHENKTVEMVLSCSLESDRTRWMEAVTPRISDNPDERIYEEWDCPQVQAIHAYAAQQPDELSLEVSDVFNVLKKTSDGWYQGERLRDGARGWFPGNHTAEIASAHVRARNLRQRYRLLAISGSIVEELKKEKERFEKEEKKKDRRRTITIKEVL